MHFSSWTSVGFTGVEVIVDDPEDNVAEDDVVIDVVLFVEPSVMFLAIPEGRLLDDTCPPRMGGHLAAVTGSSSFFFVKESSLLSYSVRLVRSSYSLLTILLLFSSASLPK